MGKKATFLLSRFLIALLTITVSSFAIAGWFARIVPPHSSWFISMMALGMFPLLIFNFTTLLFWSFRKSLWAVVPLAAILINIEYIGAFFGFNPWAKKEALPTEIKVATYNIHGYSHKNFYHILDTVLNYFDEQKVDIICFQEFCGENDYNYNELNSHYPFHIVMSDFRCMKLAIFSKDTIRDARLIQFEKSFNSAMTAEILFHGKLIHLINIHLQTTNLNQSEEEFFQIQNYGINTPEGTNAINMIVDRLKENAQIRTLQVETIRREIDDKINTPLIVCGDFNDPPSTYTYHTLKRGLTDGFREIGQGSGHTFNPLFKIFRLDYIFYSNAFSGVHRTSPRLPWSDHNPVILEMAFNKGSK